MDNLGSYGYSNMLLKIPGESFTQQNLAPSHLPCHAVPKSAWGCAVVVLLEAEAYLHGLFMKFWFSRLDGWDSVCTEHQHFREVGSNAH
jgi:hypothetical protein